MSAEPDTQDELDRLAEEFVAHARSGIVPSISEYARRHPDHADDIREIFPLLTAMEGIKAAEPMAGTQVGPYEIIREIGRGGMGVVYEAEQKDLDRHVALKILPTQATLDPRFLERFRLEAQAAAKLNHPNIVPVIGYGEDDDVHYYSMQYIEGRGVNDLIAEAAESVEGTEGGTARAYFERAARIGLQAAEALAHAHAHGVLHRDVKPTNVLLDESGHAWITDFGLCQQEGSDGLTRTGDVLGTFRYMPPERFSGVSDVRGDIYGVGITLYELLTRCRAYDDNDAAVLATRIPREEPKRPRAIEPRIPADLETIVRKAMAHDPSQRYATAEALAADLRAFLEGQPISARAPTAGYLLRKAIGRHKVASITALVATLLLVSSSVWYVLDLKEKEALARLRLYAANIGASEAAIRARDPHRAAALLEDAPEEFRNWEWRHLHSRLERSLRRFESTPEKVHGVVYHPDGRHFAAAVGGDVLVYSDETGEVVKRFAPDDDPLCLLWHPDGSRIAVGTAQSLELWTWPACERIYLGEEIGEHRNFAYAHDARWIIAGVVEGLLIRYDAVSGAEASRESVAARVLSVACAPGNLDRIVMGTGDGRVTCKRRSDWTTVWSRKVGGQGIHAVAFLDDRRVACGTNDGLVHTYAVEDGRAVRTHALHRGAGPFVADPAGQRMMVFSRGELHVFDPRGGQLQTLSGGSLPHRAAVHPKGRRAIVASALGSIREWYLGVAGDPLLLTGHMDDVITAEFGERFVASAGFGGEVRLWDVDTGELARVLYGSTGATVAVRFSPDDQWLAATNDDGYIVIWNIETGAIHRKWLADVEDVHDLRYRPDGKQVFSFGRSGVLRSWDVSSGEQHAEATATKQALKGADVHRRLAVSSDGRWVATGDEDGRVRIWNAETLTQVRDIDAHDLDVTGLAFHPHDEVLASVSKDQTLRLWNPPAGKKVYETAGVDRALRWTVAPSDVAFSPDGTRIAASTFSGSLRLWETRSMHAIADLKRERHWITEIGFSADGERLLTAMTNGQIRVWDTKPMRDRAPVYERAARLREQAHPIVKDMDGRFADPDELLRALEMRTDLDGTVKEAALRIVHEREATREGMVRRMWRYLTPADGDPDEYDVALSLARGLWRATRHREEQDARCDTLLALGYYRVGEHNAVRWALDIVGRQHELSAPELHAIDLAVASMSYADYAQVDEVEAQVKREALIEAKALLGKLEALLEEKPEVKTPRVLGFLAEARAK